MRSARKQDATGIYFDDEQKVPLYNDFSALLVPFFRLRHKPLLKCCSKNNKAGAQYKKATVPVTSCHTGYDLSSTIVILIIIIENFPNPMHDTIC